MIKLTISKVRMDSEAEKVFIRKSVYVPRYVTDMLKKSVYVDSVAEKLVIRFPSVSVPRFPHRPKLQNIAPTYFRFLNNFEHMKIFELFIGMF